MFASRLRAAWPEAALCAGFVAVSGLSRVPAFFRTVMDWDESLYFLVAAQWRAGQLPYTTIWDNKPVGIYAILAVFQALFGERVFAMRIASAVVGGLTAYVVYRIGRQLNGVGRRGPALLAGGAYLICSLSNDGMAANTEPFMAGFTALAVLAAAGPGWPWRRGVLAGVLVGAAFMVKYVAVFEAPAVLLLLLLRHPTPGWRGRIGLALAFGAGAAAPLAATILLYWHAGALGLWWSASVASNFRRVGGAVPPGALAYAARLELLRLGPLLGLGLLVLAAAARLAWRRPWRPADGVTLFLALWLLGGCVGVAAAKSFYDHYFLQLLPVLCVTLGWWASRLPGWRRPTLGLAAALVLALPAWAAVVALRQAAAPVLAWQRTQFCDPAGHAAADRPRPGAGVGGWRPLCVRWPADPVRAVAAATADALRVSVDPDHRVSGPCRRCRRAGGGDAHFGRAAALYRSQPDAEDRPQGDRPAGLCAAGYGAGEGLPAVAALPRQRCVPLALARSVQGDAEGGGLEEFDLCEAPVAWTCLSVWFWIASLRSQ